MSDEMKHHDEDWLREQVREKNRSYKDISAEIGYSTKAISRHVDKFNIVRKHDDVEWLQKKVDEGLNLTEIAEQANVGKNQTIRRRLDKFGIPLGDESICHDCGSAYSKLSTHWARSDCSWPQIDDEKWQLLKGMLMGDGSLNLSSKNPSFVIKMANEEFLNWFSDKMGFLSSGVSLAKTAKEGAEHARKTGFRPNAKEENYSDIYSWNSIRHPKFHELAQWYGDEGKKYPDDLELSHKVVKMWYCGDGYLNWPEPAANPSFNIKCTNEIENEEYLVSLFEELGYSPSINRNRIQFDTEDTRKLLKNTKPVPDGFEYKWTTESRERYKRLKSEQKE